MSITTACPHLVLGNQDIVIVVALHDKVTRVVKELVRYLVYHLDWLSPLCSHSSRLAVSCVLRLAHVFLA